MAKIIKPVGVLFLCTGNSCRSQMAEGWARHFHAGVIKAYSAGIETHGLNPYAVRVMAEAGVDISAQTSQHIDDLVDVDLKLIITICAHAADHCPRFPGNIHVIRKTFDDPPRLAGRVSGEEKILDCYRRVRDEIRDYASELPRVLRNLIRSS